MENAVARYCAASERGDIDDMIATLAPDAELISPLSGHMIFRGRDDLRVLLGAVYGSMTGLHWNEPVGEGGTRVAVSEAKVSGARLGDAMVFELDDDGLIRRIRPHLRPWFGTTAFALTVGPKIARRPDVLRRALQAR